MADDDIDDLELTRRTAAGEPIAFARLYLRHKRRALSVARRVLGNDDDAEDAVAEAFARMLRGLIAGRLSPDLSFVGYLLTVTRNAAVDRRRVMARFGEWEALEERLVSPAADETVVIREEVDRTLEALSALRPRWQLALWLTEVEQVPARDVAALLGLTPNGAAQLARRARLGLRQRYLEITAS